MHAHTHTHTHTQLHTQHTHTHAKYKNTNTLTPSAHRNSSPLAGKSSLSKPRPHTQPTAPTTSHHVNFQLAQPLLLQQQQQQQQQQTRAGQLRHAYGQMSVPSACTQPVLTQPPAPAQERIASRDRLESRCRVLVCVCV